MQTDPLNDALVKIHNAEQAGKFSVDVTPASKLLGNVLESCKKQAMLETMKKKKTDVVEYTTSNFVEQSTAVPLSSQDKA